MMKHEDLYLPLADIIIGPRQRQDLGDIAGLAESLKAHGQIQAIGVNEENKLIWGRRRLAAATLLQWEKVKVVRRASLTELDEQLIEWEEDYRQKPRNWKEKCVTLWKLYQKLKQVWVIEKGENWTQQMMADFTGIGAATSVYYMIEVAKEIEREPEGDVAKCENMLQALKIFAERRRSEAVAEQERRRQNAAFSQPMHMEELVPSEFELSNEPVLIALASQSEANKIKLHAYRSLNEGAIAGLDYACKLLLCYRFNMIGYALLVSKQGYAINWVHPIEYLGADELAPPLIWVTPGETAGLGPFALDYKFAECYCYGERVKEEWPASSVIVAPLRDDKYLPRAVVSHLLSATTIDGDLVLCLGKVNPVDVAACGRVPVFIEPDEGGYQAKLTGLKEYYEQTLGKVEFI